MEKLNNLTVKSVYQVLTINSKSGETYKTDNRLYFGISFCKSGRITYYSDDKKYVSTCGKAIVIPKNANYLLKREETGEFYIINFDIVGVSDIKEFQVINIKNEEIFFKKFELMRTLYLFNENHSKVMILMYELLELLTLESEIKQKLLSNSINYIQKNINDCMLSNSQISSEFSISEIYFRKLFKEQYGITPKQYIINARIEKSKQLLIENKKNIGEIADVCGFSSIYNFSRAFRKMCFISPSEYKINYLNSEKLL